MKNTKEPFDPFPEDINTLQRLLWEALLLNEELRKENRKLQSNVQFLQKKIEFLECRLFDSKNEQLGNVEKDRTLLSNEMEWWMEDRSPSLCDDVKFCLVFVGCITFGWIAWDVFGSVLFGFLIGIFIPALLIAIRFEDLL